MPPSELAGGLAGLAAGRLGTVALASHVAVVGIKECLTVLTLTFSDVTSHWPVSPQVNDLHIMAWKEEDREEHAERSREKKLININVSGRKRNEANLRFRPVR
jgi:hypothetical protein